MNLFMYVNKLKITDWLFLLLSLIMIAMSAKIAYGQTSAGETVSVRSPNGDWLYAIDVDRDVDGFGPEGTCAIAIEDSTVFVRESDCPENICVRTGRISRVNEWIACVPHRIFINIDGERPNLIDDVSY